MELVESLRDIFDAIEDWWFYVKNIGIPLFSSAWLIAVVMVVFLLGFKVFPYGFILGLIIHSLQYGINNGNGELYPLLMGTYIVSFVLIFFPIFLFLKDRGFTGFLEFIIAFFTNKVAFSVIYNAVFFMLGIFIEPILFTPFVVFN